MKKLILFVTGIILMSGVLAQTPQGITNQGVVRDGNNHLLVNSPIGKRVSILQGSIDGTAVYVETHALTTNSYGLITYVIGFGNAVEGSFADIDWSDGPYLLKTESDLSGGTNYSITGVTQFLSVPYALHSETAKTLSEEIVETDPLFMASPAADILSDDIDNWDEAFSWGDHAGGGYLTDYTVTENDVTAHQAALEIIESQITDLKEYLLDETDPVFEASVAFGITASNTANWDDAHSWGDHDGLYRPNDWVPGWEDMPSGSSAGEMRYWDGTNWVAIATGEQGQTLTWCNGVPAWGPCPGNDVYGLLLQVEPVEGGSVLGGGSYAEGVSVAISATANEGWEFVNWTGDTDGLAEVNDAETTLIMPAGNVTLTANFEPEEEPVFMSCGDNITFTYRGSGVTYGTIIKTYTIGGNEISLCWMDRNLGADPMPFVPEDDATGNTDTKLYGDLLQWGRLDDGHQDRSSGTTPGPTNQDVPGHGNFITVGLPYDWRSPKNDDLWQGEEGINNPCPTGWRVPTEAELNAERQGWGSANSAGAYASTLKWPVGGNRVVGGTIDTSNVGIKGFVYSSSVSSTDATYLRFGTGTLMLNGARAGGMSVRCVRNIE